MSLNRRSFVGGSAATLAALSAPMVAKASGKPKVVVIGGGAGGATVARYVAKDSKGAIDVTLIEELPDDRVRFQIMRHRHNRDYTKTVETAISRTTVVKSSNGTSEERFFVKVPVHFGVSGIIKEVEFSLVNRHSMIHRILLGREALSGTFLVDPESRYLLGQPVKKSPTKKKGRS